MTRMSELSLFPTMATASTISRTSTNLTSDMQLLRRPSTLPILQSSNTPGVHAEYKAKVVYYKYDKNLVPRACYNPIIQVQFSNMVIRSQWPPSKIKIPLVTICYIESIPKYDRFDIRGRHFQLHIVGLRDVLQPAATLEQSRDNLRFLVVRQRIPHSILKLPFEWEIQDQRKSLNKNVNNGPFAFVWKFMKNYLTCYHPKQTSAIDMMD